MVYGIFETQYEPHPLSISKFRTWENRTIESCHTPPTSHDDDTPASAKVRDARRGRGGRGQGRGAARRRPAPPGGRGGAAVRGGPNLVRRGRSLGKNFVRCGRSLGHDLVDLDVTVATTSSAADASLATALSAASPVAVGRSRAAGWPRPPLVQRWFHGRTSRGPPGSAAGTRTGGHVRRQRTWVGARPEGAAARPSRLHTKVNGASRRFVKNIFGSVVDVSATWPSPSR